MVRHFEKHQRMNGRSFIENGLQNFAVIFQTPYGELVRT